MSNESNETRIDCPDCCGCGTVYAPSGGWKCDTCGGTGFQEGDPDDDWNALSHAAQDRAVMNRSWEPFWRKMLREERAMRGVPDASL